MQLKHPMTSVVDTANDSLAYLTGGLRLRSTRLGALRDA